MGLFSTWLFEQMNERNLSINQLSKDTYIVRQTISSHLRGIHLPYRSTLRIYALYFGVDFWYLYEMVLEDSQYIQ